MSFFSLSLSLSLARAPEAAAGFFGRPRRAPGRGVNGRPPALSPIRNVGNAVGLPWRCVARPITRAMPLQSARRRQAGTRGQAARAAALGRQVENVAGVDRLSPVPPTNPPDRSPGAGDRDAQRSWSTPDRMARRSEEDAVVADRSMAAGEGGRKARVEEKKKGAGRERAAASTPPIPAPMQRRQKRLVRGRPRARIPHQARQRLWSFPRWSRRRRARGSFPARRAQTGGALDQGRGQNIDTPREARTAQEERGQRRPRPRRLSASTPAPRPTTPC